MMGLAKHGDLNLTARELKRLEKERLKQEKYFTASQWRLMWRKLLRHRLAVISFVLIALLYTGALFAGFIAPYGLEDYSGTYSNAPPSKIHFFHEGEFVGPFVYPARSPTTSFGRRAVRTPRSRTQLSCSKDRRQTVWRV